MVGKAQGRGHYKNEESAQGRAKGGFQILVMPVSEDLNVGKELKCKNLLKTWDACFAAEVILPF
jgi:hypothetical protein